MTKILPFKNELQRALPVVIGNIEFNNFKALLLRVAEIIELSGIEKQAIQYIIDEGIEDGLRSAKAEDKTTTPLSALTTTS